ncbi:SMP-30/gluconolactonase/LRE family protein [Hyphococcus luteus]|uniref:SMP-30/Gluconolactonase/LRE-like region domain-containing protein n=1 Tax=Hyphococcus luteus TaxID=2058213 RepID=A0A2S7JZL8_9PROT|nr:hypothetical protein [Marinicaulis flavus]PQA85695.1 hypothetical protein CW354_22475 [Marinicaulis flavus]
MKKTILAILALCAVSAAHAAPQSYRDNMAAAGKAYEDENWPALNEALNAAQAMRPWSLYVYRNRILARLLAGREEEALGLAEKAADRGLALDLSGHPAFDKLAALSGFEAITARMEENAKPKGGGGPVRTFAETGLLPEAIAYGRKQTLYVGGVRTGEIVKAGEKAERLSPVAAAPGGVFDLEVRARHLWAAVNNPPPYEHAAPDKPFAAIMIFDGKTGRIVREARVGEDAAMLGDLEVAKDGTAYASDSKTPRIYRLAPGDNAPEIFMQDPRFVNLQGLALDEEHGRLFVADYLAGLFVVDLETGEATQIENAADAHLGGVDGLYYHEGVLIGVQNGTTPQRIVRIGLDEAGASAVSFTVLQQNLADWNEPTHGAVVGDNFHYIATSNWPSYNQDGGVKDKPARQPLRIMTAPLDGN